MEKIDAVQLREKISIAKMFSRCSINQGSGKTFIRTGRAGKDQVFIETRMMKTGYKSHVRVGGYGLLVVYLGLYPSLGDECYL